MSTDLETLRDRLRPTPARRAQRRLRTLLSTVPALYMPMRRIRRAETVANPGTELMIEGYPRCGNTWTEMALREAAERPIPMAHHSHAAAHVVYAVRQGIPALVLFREPDAAVRSLLAMQTGSFSVEDAYREFAIFYRRLEALPRDQLLFASFEDVTQRMGPVISALKARFDLPLAQIDPDAADVKAAIFARMDARAGEIREDGEAKSMSNPTHYDETQMMIKRLAAEEVARVAGSPVYAAAHEVFARLTSDIP